ncbi:MAG: 1-aminocyclopropane-1-carboxylate deaminase/D-cysteine desulfhydrase [Thermaurantimonas sp.]
MRDDLIHPVISGNKLRKLWPYLQLAAEGRKGIETYGGPYSNHLVATAFAASVYHLPARGYVRGGYAPTSTTEACTALGMQLITSDKNTYTNRKNSIQSSDSAYISVPEGGKGLTGVEGVKMSFGDQLSPFDEIWLAAGTLTTAIGIALAAPCARVVAVPVLRAEGEDLMRDYETQFQVKKPENLFFSNGFHFGGYARWDEDLLAFSNEWFEKTGIMTDLVYTAKSFYAFAQESNSPWNVSKLLIHTGGLQGMMGILPQIKKKNLRLVYEAPLVAHLSATHPLPRGSKPE